MILANEFYEAWKYCGIEDGAKLLKDVGFDGVDMSYYYDASEFFLGEDYREKALAVKTAFEKNGLVCNQAHAPIECYYGMMLDDSAPEYVRVKRALESAAIIGAKQIVVEGTEVPAPHTSYLNLDYNYKFYKSLEPLCREFGIVVAVENLRKSFTYPDLMNEIIRRLNSPYFKALVDVGHTWCRADMQPGEYIRSLDPGILCGLHIHDTHGIRKGADEHLVPWMAELDYEDLLQALKDVGYGGDFTLETTGFVRNYASKGLLEPALRFTEAVGRRLIAMYEALN